jgi:hypothetical protein
MVRDGFKDSLERRERQQVLACCFARLSLALAGTVGAMPLRGATAAFEVMSLSERVSFFTMGMVAQLQHKTPG